MSWQTKWKLLAVLIVASALLGVVGWQQFTPKPVLLGHNLSLGQTCSSEEARLGQIVNVVISAQNNDEKEFALSKLSVKLPLGFYVLRIDCLYPNGTRISGLSVETDGELKHTKVLLKPKQRLSVSFSLNTTLDSRTSNFTTTMQATYDSGGIFGIGRESTTVTKSVQTTIRVPLQAWYSFLREIDDGRWLKYVIAGNLCIEDRKLADIEKAYLSSPTPENAQKVIGSYLSDIARIPDIGPELTVEFPRVPDFGYDNKTVEALEDILQLAMKPNHKQGFLSMLNEGVKEKRKYCTPLQALIWYYADRDPDSDGPLKDSGFTVKDFVEFAWRFSSTSDNYRSDRWRDFEEVRDRLNGPILVSIFMVNNIYYDNDLFKEIERTGIVPRTRTPVQTFMDRKGICTEQAWFAFSCLYNGGYEYDYFDLHGSGAAGILQLFNPAASYGRRGHAVCLYKERGDYYAINNGRIQGPFSSIKEAAGKAFPEWKTFEIYISY
jgi:hypothetical protein